MHFRVATAVVAVLLGLVVAGGGPAAAQSPQRRCDSTRTPVDQRIAACTTLVDSGRLSGARLADALNSRGHARFTKGAFAEAAADFAAAARLDPAAPRYLMNLALAQRRSGDPAAGLATLDRLLAVAPRDADAWWERGLARVALGDRRAAIADYDKAIEIDPRHSRAFNSRCYSRAVLGDLDGAIEDCDRALEIDPRSVDALDSRGYAALRLGRLDDAISHYDRALRIAPRQAEPLFGRGVARLRKGDARHGNADLAAARKADPGIDATMARIGVTP